MNEIYISSFILPRDEIMVELEDEMKPKKSFTPATCSESQLCKIRRDNIGMKDFSIMTDSFTVWLSEQKIGEPRKQHIEIPRAVFNKLVRWYLKPQKVVRK